MDRSCSYILAVQPNSDIYYHKGSYVPSIIPFTAA